MFMYRSKANLDLKIFFRKIIHLIDLEINNMLVKGGLHTRFWSVDYLPLKFEFNAIVSSEREFKCQWQNHGPEMEYGILVPIQTPSQCLFFGSKR